MREILSLQNEQIKNDRLLQEKKVRDNKGLFVVEGIKLILEAEKNGFSIERVYVDGEQLEKYQDDLNLLNNVDIIKTTAIIIEKLCDAKSHQGILAVCKKRQSSIQNSHNRSLILENLQDPKNVGSLLRTAAATSFVDVFLIDCADPYSQKCVRASMSGIFKVNLNFVSLDECFDRLLDCQILCGDMSGENLFDAEIQSENVAIAVGNEGNGVSENLKNKSNKTVKIPMDNDLESLNVAVSGSVLMYEIKRRNK
ncbi:MAG: RNA methyltransferase [Clostridia bacterium]